MKEFLKHLKFTWKYSKNQKSKLILYILVNMSLIAFSILTPIIGAKRIVALTSNQYEQLLYVSVILLVIAVIDNIFTFITRILSNKIYRNTLSELEIDLSKNVLRIENKCLDKNGSGLFIQRLTGDTSKIADSTNRILDILSDVITYIGIIIAMITVNKILFIYIVITISIMAVLENQRTKQRNKDDKETRKANEKVTGFVGELVRGARDIKMLNSEKDFINELSVKIENANNKRYIMHRNNFLYRLLNWELLDIFSFILIMILLILMKNNYITSAVALVAYNYAGRLTGSIYLFGNIMEYFKEFNLSVERVYEVIHGNDFKKEKFGNKHLDKVEGNFEFKDVEFKYNKDKILKGINFKIKANETVAFVGKSGAGKTTIFNLLCKMYEPTKGKITIDGNDINKLDKESIRGNITIISQDPYIFNLSIRDNLRLVKSDLTEEEMIDACKAACLDEFINTLPDKYDTMIGEGGVNLSGGQKQRLAIARALVQKTEIILFDEATSALDNETQSKIQEAISNMKGEYTILIIAHRLSTIINSDKIMFIDDGVIKAEGTHKELMNNCEEYKKLYESEINK